MSASPTTPPTTPPTIAPTSVFFFSFDDDDDDDDDDVLGVDVAVARGGAVESEPTVRCEMEVRQLEQCNTCGFGKYRIELISGLVKDEN